MPHANTARCETTAHCVDRLDTLVPHRLEHLVAFRAQLGGVVSVHLSELCTLNPSCPVFIPTFFATFPPDGFHRPWESTPGHERGVAIRDNHGPLVSN